METFEQYALINQKKWTELLKELEVGEHVLTLPSIPDIHSLKSVAYFLNGNRIGRKYALRADKDKLIVTITVRQQ